MGFFVGFFVGFRVGFLVDLRVGRFSTEAAARAALARCMRVVCSGRLKSTAFEMVVNSPI